MKNKHIGWVFLYPLVLIRTLALKFKNRKLATEDGYIIHQKEFFGAPIVDKINYSGDKFYKFRKKIAKYAFNGEGKKALDIATGYGFQAKALKDVGFKEVIALDIVPERIKRCEKLYGKEGIAFKVGDATNIFYPDNYFDVVTVSVALHDMPNKVKRKAISEMSRVSKNLVIIFEPRTFSNPLVAWLYGTFGGLLDESLNFKEYVKDDLDKILRDNKLKIIKNENVWHNLLNIKVCKIYG